ncbi:MAG: DUF6896 domain-containing protein [Janthinobacterium lividum]
MIKPEKQQLLELVYEYRAAVKKAVSLLNAKSERAKGFQRLGGEISERAGYLDDLKESRYEFHGFGCLIVAKDFTVDFDFGEGGRCDGIDPGFLLSFINGNSSIENKYPLYTSREQLKESLEHLEKESLFTRDLEPFLGHPMELYNDTLFYLVAAINDVDKPIWKPYWPGGWDADDNDA